MVNGKSGYQQLVEANVGINNNLKRLTDLVDEVNTANNRDHVEVKTKIDFLSKKLLWIVIFLLAILSVVVGAEKVVTLFI